MVNVAAGPNKHINTSGKGPETRRQLQQLDAAVAAATGNTRRSNFICSDTLLTKINPRLRGKHLLVLFIVRDRS